MAKDSLTEMPSLEAEAMIPYYKRYEYKLWVWAIHMKYRKSSHTSNKVLWALDASGDIARYLL